MVAKIIAPIESHIKYGDEFKRLDKQMIDLSIEISNTNGKTKVRRITDKIDRANKLMSQARSDMENLMFAEYKEETRKETQLYLSVYYGKVGEFKEELKTKNENIQRTPTK